MCLRLMRLGFGVPSWPDCHGHLNLTHFLSGLVVDGIQLCHVGFLPSQLSINDDSNVGD
jgi:hypothetical protein